MFLRTKHNLLSVGAICLAFIQLTPHWFPLHMQEPILK
jgi:hypothetical protein